jgi:hypothetical protein
MLDPTSITHESLASAVAAIAERVELSGHYSELFVDANLLERMVPAKNQAVFGRRGTGKTHLLGRLQEYYRDSYGEQKILPVLVDGRNLATKAVVPNATDVISLLITYRRLLEAILDAIEKFTQDEVTLTVFERIWPVNKRRQKLPRIREEIAWLRSLVRFGTTEIGPGKVTIRQEDKAEVRSSRQIAVDVKLAATATDLLGSKAQLDAGMARGSNKSAADNMTSIYEGLTVIDFAGVSAGLDAILYELDAEGVALLFDEWSAIDVPLQPLFADMLRSTLSAGRRLFIKFACIPYLTQLSTVNHTGAPVGLPIGEEVFADVDLDQYWNPYLDVSGVTSFLLAVLHRHLGIKISTLADINPEDASEYFMSSLFDDPETVSELVYASAGTPRDFLRVFARAFDKSRNSLPIKVKNAREATHDLFQAEKKAPVQRDSVYRLFELIFNEVCWPSNSTFFLVSQDIAEGRLLQELWHRRLIHNVYTGLIIFVDGNPRTYDFYAIDYGRLVLMRSMKEGEQWYSAARTIFSALTNDLPFQALDHPALSGIRNLINRRLARFAFISSGGPETEVMPVLENPSKFVADAVISTFETPSHRRRKGKRSSGSVRR